MVTDYPPLSSTLFIIFSNGDRLPSVIQYLSMSGSIMMLSVPRIEAWLLDQGGVTLPIKEKILKTLYLFPLFFFNSIFKLGCIGLICAILRYNAFTFYGVLILLWITFYILFNERCLPRRYYHLILGVVMHAVSIGKIPDKAKNIDLKLKRNHHHKTTSRRMTSRHQMQNIIFQNSLWLVINTIMLIMLIILTSVRSSLWTLWPIVDSRYDILSLPITKFVPILVPVILACGVLSLLLIFVQLGCGDDPNEDDCEDTECEDGDETKDDPSVQAKVARKMEPVLNIVASATDVEI